MKLPQSPPKIEELLKELAATGRLKDLIVLARDAHSARKYLHWDDLRRRGAPDGLNHREWWLILKLSRLDSLKRIPLTDKAGISFQFAAPEIVLEGLHELDLGAGGIVGFAEQITNSHTRDRYVVSSLVEEAITSSQLEGAVTTREVAKEMIQSGRKPRDISERMILNNFATMQRVRELKNTPLTPELVFEIHRLVTDETMDDPSAAGRLRRTDEERVVGDDFGQIFHVPPPAHQLMGRLEAMCAFANKETPDFFTHPVLRAIMLHFWLAYDHPFVDGNGRTARALFYWAMLRGGYWLFEYISISSILRKAPAQYGLSFLHTETDDNDLTYFIIAQMEVIRRAMKQLHAYIERKTTETRVMENRLRALDMFNHRQSDLLRHALKHQGERYTITGHQTKQGVVYQTARTDLIDLANRGILELHKKGNQMVFLAPFDLEERLVSLERNRPPNT
jgi:Fic family protein